MQPTEVHALAEELIHQVWPMPIGGTVALVFIFANSDWSGLGFAVALAAALLISWAVTRPRSLPTNWAPNWRGIEQPTPETVDWRRTILASQDRGIMRWIAGGEILLLSASFVWSWFYRPFLPTDHGFIVPLVFIVFVFTAIITSGGCWLGVYVQMRFKK